MQREERRQRFRNVQKDAKSPIWGGTAQVEEFRGAIDALWHEHKLPGFRKTVEQRALFIRVAWNSFLVFLSVCEHVYNMLEEDARSFGARPHGRMMGMVFAGGFGGC